jgi:phosphatidylglycerophosphate synthase
MTQSSGARRPLKSRQTGWAKKLAQFLVKSRISPNAISIASVFFAIGAGVAFYFASPDNPIRYMQMLVIAAVAIQGRLLCNLLDGMVAVEGGRQTKSGEVFNDLPDRIADSIIFIQAGYAVHSFTGGRELGWAAALLAVFTAYVRMLGGASGLKQSFMGPMAKQHRMAVMTAACVLSIFESWFVRTGTLLWVALIVVVVGCVVTIVLRTVSIIRGLEAR